MLQAFVFFGFESAADVSEEIIHAKKSVPRAMILSLAGAGKKQRSTEESEER